MDYSDVQVQNAIQIAWNPTSDQSLKSQAFEFLNQLRASPSAANVCLSLFVREPPVDEIVRHFALEVVNNAVQFGQLDGQSLQQIKGGLLDYIQSHYSSAGSHARLDSPTIQNKLAQTLTFLFESMYQSGWETFFDDIRGLSGNDAAVDGVGDAGTLLYLRVLASVHDEIADQLVNTSPERQKLFTELKDLIRVRDITKIATSWQDILSRHRQAHGVIIELCLKTISRWVSWTDISLIVTEAAMSQLFDIAAQRVDESNQQQVQVRNAAIDVFTEIVGKKMKPAEKIELVRFLNLDEVVTRLEASPGLSDSRGGPLYDTDMAETVAKLVNNIVLDLVKILDSGEANDEARQNSEQSLQQFVPHLLRFFADEYDEVCSTVIQALNDLLNLLRKFSVRGALPIPYNQMIKPILDAIIAKMRYDDTSSWGEQGEETDEAEFQELRKRLRVLQSIVAQIDEPLYMETLSNVVTPVFASLKQGSSKMNWRDLELAMLEMYLLGELAIRNGGLYHKKKPSSAASEKLIHFMSLMLDCDAAAYPHAAIHLQYMESCIRHTSFFEQHSQYVPRVLEHFITFVHSDHVKLRARSHHYFLRLVRDLKSKLGGIAENVIRAIQDLLVVRAEVPDDSGTDDTSSNEDGESADAVFNGQLHLFEAVGCITSASSVSPDTQATLVQSILEPLSSGIARNTDAATSGDERAIFQIHHLMMAIGTLARGFSDWVPGKSKPPIAQPVSDEFTKSADTILRALASTKGSLSIRSAARFSFSRMIGVVGYRVLEQLSQWIDGLLAETSTKDEMATFLKLLDQIIFGFKTQIFSTLDTLLTPLLQRIFAGLSEPTTGTDDEIQLGELRREYLNFFLVVLNNNLETVLVSPSNQSIFETVITSIEHYARDTVDNSDSKLAMAVLTRMSSVWGGPDIANPLSNPASPAPLLPGFDQFMLSRFSALTWQIMGSPAFNPKAANANRELGEVAALQQMILAKTGREYLNWLREVELKNLGASEPVIDEYLTALVTKDQKAFKGFLVSFLQRGRS